MLRTGTALLAAIPVLCPAQNAGVADTQDLRTPLQSAWQSQARGNTTEAVTVLSTLIADPRFSQLDEPTQHVALQLGAQYALQGAKPELALEYARRASEMSLQTLDDWKYRLTAAVRVRDVHQELLCITTIAQRAGRDRSVLPAAQVMTALAQSGREEFKAERLAMLRQLYAVQWRPESDGSASRLWRDATR
jgi:hypothetical protein